ncbi:hypothetical protein M422DRAFT_261530 [Sphaerobolus stellatus SS14]|uniref:NADH:flavin oxidoreductase/NADH oxidase N-terminal domain-containing protein n=1 Tax=Sphaerobolus stellatus (strain SS14) TaxID=990650 RepID=A0A0C9UMW8_SPHS4|nr:hypothetical protein M422DRAFT_261530 [Sphaerobolus stellatus SS14]
MPEQIVSGKPVWAPPIAARGGKFKTLPGPPGYVTPTEFPNPWVMTLLNNSGMRPFMLRKLALMVLSIRFHSHGANSYLPDQFLDSASNKRTDICGGSVNNRSRFILEATKSLASVWGADRVAVKLSPTGGYNNMGMPLEETLETFRYLIMELDAMKLAYLALMRG